MVKGNLCLVCRYHRLNVASVPGEEVEEGLQLPAFIYLWSAAQSYSGIFSEWWNYHCGRILSKMDNLHQLGSTLVFDRVTSLSYRVTLTYINAEAHGFIPTPSAIGKKKGRLLLMLRRMSTVLSMQYSLHCIMMTFPMV